MHNQAPEKKYLDFNTSIGIIVREIEPNGKYTPLNNKNFFNLVN